MDCMNSSESSHSSSGGEEECDSRADQSFSSFGHLGPTFNPAPPPPSQHNHHTTTNLSNFPSSSSSSFMYDPLFSSTFLDPSSLLLNTNPNMVWSKTSCTTGTAQNSSMLLSTYSHDQAQLKDQGGSGRQQFSPSMMLSNEGTHVSRQLSNDSSTINNPNSNKNNDADDSNNINNSSSSNNNNIHHLAVRNPKKRSRASRRAPTTVLTTDTTNFRAMVQEFTGIPAPPFAAAVASTFNRTRPLDLFGGSSNPPYLLRPFAQRSHNTPSYLPTAPSSSSLSILTNPVMSNTNPLSSIDNNSSSNSMHYQLESLPSNLSLLKSQPLNLLNMSQIMQSQSSLIHDLPKYPLGNASTNFPPSKPSGSSLLDNISTTSDQNMKMGGLGTQFGLDTNHHRTGGFRDEETPTTSWDVRLGSKNVDDQGLLRSISGSFGNFQRVSNEDKRIDESNGSTRSESMVEPWLRSSSSG